MCENIKIFDPWSNQKFFLAHQGLELWIPAVEGEGWGRKSVCWTIVPFQKQNIVLTDLESKTSIMTSSQKFLYIHLVRDYKRHNFLQLIILSRYYRLYLFQCSINKTLDNFITENTMESTSHFKFEDCLQT
jgi:hypothetical protein